VLSFQAFFDNGSAELYADGSFFPWESEPKRQWLLHNRFGEPSSCFPRGNASMSESQQSKVFMFDNDDAEMQRAYQNARANFRYFWRENAWERRRIVPGLDLSCVKAPFTDGKTRTKESDPPAVEEMWFSEVDFDGREVSGVLLNAPNWLKSIKQGDAVRMPLAQISDWMYAINGEVFGAYTVNLIRSRMSRQERQDHDNAWGLNFGDPNKIRVMPEPKSSGGFFKSLFGKKEEPSQDHPMSINMAPSLQEELKKKPKMLLHKDEQGWTLLHHEALAGSAPTVKVLLAAGADRTAKTNHGATPLQLAKSLGWEHVVALLAAK